MANPVKIKAQVLKVQKHDEGVYTVQFGVAGRKPRFKPGQFLHLAIDEYDPTRGFWPESRVFSIASLYAEEDVCIVYSVKGKFTRRMQEYLAPGKSVWLKFPYGDFIIDSQRRDFRDVILIAGGTGISPFVPFLKELINSKINDGTVHLFYGARNYSLILFKDLLQAGLKVCDDFHVTLFTEEPPDDDTRDSGMEMIPGIISVQKIVENIPGWDNPCFFISGPPQMIRVCKETLLQNNVPENSIKTDEWE